MTKLDAGSTALLLIECQNDFMSEGGAFHGSCSSVLDSTGMVGNARQALSAARTSGATVMHAPIAFAPGYAEVGARPYGVLGGVVEGGALVQGEWGSEIVGEFAPKGDDIVIEGKRGLDTFASTNLDFILRSKRVDNLVVGGFLTNCCVESTIRSGYERGYQVFALTDCMGALSLEEHENAIRFDFPMFSRALTAGELTAALG